MKKFLIGVWRSVLKLFRKPTPHHYKLQLVTDSPSVIKSNIVYIVNEGLVDESLIFECPCKCGSRIELNLLPDARPVWRYHIEKREISITPSIWRKHGCRSHFFLTQGQIKWV